MSYYIYLRLIALGFSMACIASFPYAITRQGRHWSAWFAVAGCELFMLGALVAVADHFNSHHLAWYRTPLTIVASSLILIFIVYVYKHPNVKGRI